MTRVKRGVTVTKKHKKLKKSIKGYRGARSRRIKAGREALLKALAYSYRDRRTKKREFRKLWITRINAALKDKNLNYSQFIKALKEKNIELDRKILADLALNEPEIFQKVIEKVKNS